MLWHGGVLRAEQWFSLLLLYFFDKISNMGIRSQKSQYGLAVLVGLSFLTLALIGPTHAFGMEMNKNGNMNGCIFTGKAEICRMNFLEHLTSWQALFNVLPIKATTALLTTLLLFIFVFAIFERKLCLIDLINPILNRKKLYSRSRLDFPSPNSLQEAFSQGILNSKTY